MGREILFCFVMAIFIFASTKISARDESRLSESPFRALPQSEFIFKFHTLFESSRDYQREEIVQYFDGIMMSDSQLNSLLWRIVDSPRSSGVPKPENLPFLNSVLKIIEGQVAKGAGSFSTEQKANLLKARSMMKTFNQLHHDSEVARFEQRQRREHQRKYNSRSFSEKLNCGISLRILSHKAISFLSF